MKEITVIFTKGFLEEDLCDLVHLARLLVSLAMKNPTYRPNSNISSKNQ